MDSERKITVEPAGRSEADWSSAPLSSAGLPDFVEGEFKHMIGLEEGEDGEQERPLQPGFWGEDDTPSERERIVALADHMDRLLEAAGKDREATAEGLTGLLSRFADRWTGD